MIKKVIWSSLAENDLYSILAYWIYRNKSAIYSIKLEAEIQKSIQAIIKNPFIGRRTNKENIRLKLVGDYWIVYEITAISINIISIFDTRQNHSKLRNRIKKG